MSVTHTANVIVRNESSATVSDIMMTHRFGDGHTDQLNWDETLGAHGTTSSKHVTYKTGFGAMTSFDWWIVTWKSNGSLCTSSPSLLNYLADFLSQGATAIANVGAASVAYELAGETSVEAKKATSGTTLLVACTSIFIGTILKRESKAEFKEFMLRSEDAASGVTITLTDDRVMFAAASGTADTKYGSTPIPADVAAQIGRQIP